MADLPKPGKSARSRLSSKSSRRTRNRGEVHIAECSSCSYEYRTKKQRREEEKHGKGRKDKRVKIGGRVKMRNREAGANVTHNGRQD